MILNYVNVTKKKTISTKKMATVQITYSTLVLMTLVLMFNEFRTQHVAAFFSQNIFRNDFRPDLQEHCPKVNHTFISLYYYIMIEFSF